MATILLSAAGAAIGGSVGGTLAGLSSVAIGRAVGATLGQVLDQRLLGSGSAPVETGKVERFRLTSAGDGAPIPQVFGRMRVGGQIIWASDFQEVTSVSGGGKGAPKAPKTTQYSYSVSLAVAVCEGEIAGINRVWADGEEVSKFDLNMEVYPGTRTQQPDPVMEAVEGVGEVPAYRGTAYVVFKDLPLEQFGNRVPQFSFEVVRPEHSNASDYQNDVAQQVRGVALMPGTGEYALAETPVYYGDGPGARWAANTNSPSGLSDLATSISVLKDELPKCGSVSLVVSWFGNDLRCGNCTVQPKIERRAYEGTNMAWRVAGLNRASAEEIARVDDRPIYGGTPADASVIESIRHMKSEGLGVMFYPFILMEQQVGNGLPDPWTGLDEQPPLPWRGRITLSKAPGQVGSPDGSLQADEEVRAFFGNASASDFSIGENQVSYSGPSEWGLRRFILHYAALCVAAGGVNSFCIGSEMRGLTQIRGSAGFVAVSELRALAAEVRALLGPDVKLGYAADWSEYFGYMPQDGTGDRYFHLDPLWADENIDFVGIDNYMPLSDWRDGEDHLDAHWQHIYNEEYLRSNVQGAEGYDWFYHSEEARAAQIRTDITDGSHGEPWIWRYKDIRNWWENRHHERIGGKRQGVATAWQPRSKPIWFTELGCAAIDKGTNQPNKFLDEKSSESSLPRFSSGARDDLIQMAYLRAVFGYWGDAENNPVSDLYEGPMIDLSQAHVWAWDARPFPAFPNNRELWSDGENYARGHWLNGRTGGRLLSSVVAEICRRAGVAEIDTSQLHGFVRGYVIDNVSDARSALQPLMLRFGFDAVERDGVLRFVMRRGTPAKGIDLAELVETDETNGLVERSRASEAEMTGRVRVRFMQADAGHEVLAEEAVLPEEATHAVSNSDLPMSLTRAEGRATAERWLAEARLSRDSARLVLPPSRIDVGAGDIIEVPSASTSPPQLYRVDRVEQTSSQLIEAVRIEPETYRPGPLVEVEPTETRYDAPVPVLPFFLDLPLLTGNEDPIAPHIAVTGQPWAGQVAIYSSASDEDYGLSQIIEERSIIGFTETVLERAAAGIWDRGPALRVKFVAGTLQSRQKNAILNGANLAAIGDGTSGNWELFQFEQAILVKEDTYELSIRLRGQLGTDSLMPDQWRVGSAIILMENGPSQIDLKPAQRGVARHYRIGPARRGYDDPSFIHKEEVFSGNGLRPYAPCHLRVSKADDGALTMNWIRRTRVDGDSWELAEVPLGEETEHYLARVLREDEILRETVVAGSSWTYSDQAQRDDGVQPGDVFEVRQLSARYGAGLAARLTLLAG